MSEASLPTPESVRVPAEPGERASVRRFGVAILVRALVGTALWLAVHRSVAMTAVLVASCWWPWGLVHRASRLLGTDRERARQLLSNSGLVVFLATAAWTLWGLVLAGKGKDVGGSALALLWTFLSLCFVVDFVLFRWAFRALPERDGPPPGVSAEEALRPGGDGGVNG